MSASLKSKVLLVEDSPIVTKIIKHIAKNQPIIDLVTAATFEEARAQIDSHGAASFLAAIVDLNLPDAPDGEVVDYTIKLKMPTIVLTGSFDEERREKMLNKKIVDYIVKESRFSYEYVLKLILRLRKNQNIKVLVIDDSKMSRSFIVDMLKTHLYEVCTAEDGDDGLELINSDPDIKLVITDYNMPRMNGFELVKNVRKEVSKNDLVIIGLSGQGDAKLSAKFIKNGANDFLTKPFSHEEFHCRVLHNIENIEHIESMNYMAYHDYVTGLPNKRYFFEHATEQIQQLEANGTQSCLALISIDQLNDIHDQYGYDAAEHIVKEFAMLLDGAFSRFTYAQLNDAECAVLLAGLDEQKAYTLVDSFRQMIEDHIILLDESSVNLTISAGISSGDKAGLSERIKAAEAMLFESRLNGDNGVKAG